MVVVFLLLALYNGVYAVEDSVKITDLKASDGSKVEVVDSLKIGDLLLTDRNYTITQIPDKYLSLPWIRTANNSKKFVMKPYRKARLKK